MRSLVEWVVALGLFAGVIWLGLPWVRQMVPLPTGTVTLVESQLPALPAGVPGRAQSVPFLMLESGLVIRLGHTEADLASQGIASLTAGASTTEAGVIDQRVIKAYRDGRSRFWVVLDKTGPGREREVTAIYVR